MVSRRRIAELEAAIVRARADHENASDEEKEAAYERLTALKTENRDYQRSTDWDDDEDSEEEDDAR